MLLSELGIIDLRSKLPHRNWSIGTRKATTSLTWHYNGPFVAPERQFGAGLLAQLIADSEWQMKPGWGNAPSGAPHLMYHFVVASDGLIYLTADIDEILWHCAHAEGNERGLSLHFPLGKGQKPGGFQLYRATRLTDALCAQYQIPRPRVLGHLEWKHATLCPGPILMDAVLAYRRGNAPAVQPTPLPAGIRRFRITADKANVRQAPATRLPDGTAVPIAGKLKATDIVLVDVVKTDGEKIGPKANPNWLHMALVPHEQGDLGFLSETVGEWIS